MVAFTREISTVGIGLLHNVQLSPGRRRTLDSQPQGLFDSRPHQNSLVPPCGEGWFISGGQFVGTAFVEP